MKKMTLKEARKALSKSYMEALSFFAEYIGQFDIEDRELALEELDEKIFEKANGSWGLGEEWLHIYSGLMIAVEEDDEE